MHGIILHQNSLQNYTSILSLSKVVDFSIPVEKKIKKQGALDSKKLARLYAYRVPRMVYFSAFEKHYRNLEQALPANLMLSTFISKGLL